jgi:abi-like family protein
LSRQPKWNNRELVNHLVSKDVTFDNISIGQAITFLDKNNYYYKLAAFRKNFKKKDDKYVDLDFSYLQDLASLDMKIRAILLNIAVDVEHFIKVELSRQINNNPQEDGYSILTEFKNSQYSKYYEFTKKKFRESRYQNAMFNKRKHDYPYWALLEHMDYGCLIKFVNFYYQKHGCKSLKKASELGDGARHIRNACAHNSVLLLNVFEKNDKLSNVNAVVTTFAKQVDVIKYKNYKKVNDLISLLVLAKTYCSPAVLKYQKQAIDNFIVRCRRNQSAYAKNVELTKMMVVFKKIVDIL